MSDQRPGPLARLDEIAGAALLKARPWDVVGAALGVPMLVWGLLGWFGTVGDSGGGVSGFYSGTGAAGIALVLVAASLVLNQILAGQAHTNTAPPVAVLLSGSAAVLILGGVLAKPDSTTIQAGAVTGLLTAISQCVVLTVGWVKGSGKAVKAATLAAMTAQQDAADEAARQGRPLPGYGRPNPSYPGATQPGYGQPGYGQPGYGQPGYGQPGYGQPNSGQPNYPPAGAPPRYPAPGYPPPGYPQPAGPQPGYPPPPGYLPPGYPPPGYQPR